MLNIVTSYELFIVFDELIRMKLVTDKLLLEKRKGSGILLDLLGYFSSGVAIT